MASDLDEVYRTCTACVENAISKMQKVVETVQVSLDKLAPNEVISLDFGSLEGSISYSLKIAIVVITAFFYVKTSPRARW